MKERNYGIDLLRIISMYMVCTLHLLGHGGLLSHAIPQSSNYWMAWFLNIFAYCAVDCFALISGFVLYQSSAKIARLFELWLHILFYSITITAIMFALFPSTRAFGNIVNAIFPISRRQYWYLSSYFGMYLLLPVLNLAVNQLEQGTLKRMLLAMFVGMSILPTVLRTDPYILNGGYCTLWCSILYLTGGYIAKYNVHKKISSLKSGLYFWGCIIVTFLSKILLEYATLNPLGEENLGTLFVSYVSPTIVLSAIFLLLFCLNLNLSPVLIRMIKVLAPASLGVYMIHDHPLLSEKIISNLTVPLLNYPFFVLALLVPGSAALLYLLCSCIDLLRIQLFRILKVHQFSKFFERHLVAFVDKLMKE